MTTRRLHPVSASGQWFCVSPSTCCKCVIRDWFTFSKCAVPCDDEVPCACALCGCTLCGANDKYKKVYISTKAKSRGNGDVMMKSQEMMRP